SLATAEWTRLMADALATERGRAADPLACLDMEKSMAEPYCQVLMAVFGFLASGEQPPSAAISRRSEALELAHSPAAPPEVRLQGQLLRVVSGEATAPEILEVWRDKSLGPEIRRYAIAGGSGKSVSGLSEAVETELRGPRVDAADATTLLKALRNL